MPPLKSGTIFGPYEIVAPLGAGGMGEVYQARDKRLDRIVAVKVLPSHIAAREDLRARFEREARIVSSLKHPNICVLFDVGCEQGVDYMVLEHLEGETLSNRLRKGPLPFDQAMTYAMQIADALDRAHRSGVLHRDLKPGNIMLTRDGAKVLDFGLAKTGLLKATQIDGPTVPITAEGTVVGTPQYLAPELIEGGEADARSDIFAFGCVLYEMVTGKRAFDGKTSASVIGAILSAEPQPMSTLQPVTPPALEKVVKRCLAKDPEERSHCLRDVLLELRSINAPSQAPLSKAPLKVPWAVAAVVLLGAGAAAGWLARSSEPPRRFQFSITAPEGTSFVPIGAGTGGIALSPDGTIFAFTGRARGSVVLFVRRLDSTFANQVQGTEGAVFPFWSPDNRSIGFFSEGKLKRADLAAGSVQAICDAPSARGGTWNQSGIILFSGGPDRAIYQVSENGGAPSRATSVNLDEGEMDHLWPWFLPDGDHFLYSASSSARIRDRKVYIGSLRSPEDQQLLLSGPSFAAFTQLPSSGLLDSIRGYLVYRTQDAIMAQPFNTDSLRPQGKPVLVSGQLHPMPIPASGFTISAQGLLAYENRTGDVRLTWRERNGRSIGVSGAPATYGSPRLAPDGKRLAFGRTEGVSWQVWIHDLDRDTSSRFTFDTLNNIFPVWSPAGDRLAFVSGADGDARRIYSKAATGVGEPKQLAEAREMMFVYDWSSDGKYLLYGAGLQTDIMAISLDGDRKPLPLVTSSSSDWHAQLSPAPSGSPKWLAYDSAEDGTRQVFVRPFTPGRPAGGARWQISIAGGTEPRWRADGKEIYFLSLDGKMMAVSVKTDGEAFNAGSPVVLFETPARSFSAAGSSYDVTPDGQRFILLEPPEASSEPVTVIVNWFSGIT